MAWDPEIQDHSDWAEELGIRIKAEETTNLHQALDAQVKKTNAGYSAPSLQTLNGLSRVLAAYVRGMNGLPEHGPKHAMQFVNKNPLQDIIANAAANMSEDGPLWLSRLTNACVDLVAEGRPGNCYNWAAKKLSVADWANSMKQSHIDLLSVYDKAYRSAQIGHLSSLNDVSSVPGKGAEAPIIEFRDLDNTQPSKMVGIFQEIIEKLDTAIAPSYVDVAFPEEYVPTMFDSYVVYRSIDEIEKPPKQKPKSKSKSTIL